MVIIIAGETNGTSYNRDVRETKLFSPPCQDVDTKREEGTNAWHDLRQFRLSTRGTGMAPLRRCHMEKNTTYIHKKVF